MNSMVPFRGHRALSRPLMTNSLFDDNFFRSFFNMNDAFVQTAFRVDIKDKDDHFEIAAELPGVPQDKIELTVDDGVLTIAADFNTENKTEKENYVYCERRSGHFQRSFNLEGVREEDINANYKDGVLTVSLPKQQQEQQKTQRRIEIQ